MRDDGIEVSWKRSATRLLAAVAAFAALATVAFSGMSSSSARIAANTDSDGFLAAGTVVIERATESTGLFFDAENLYPGAVTTGCVVLEYAGSAPAELRLAARADGGSGLDEFIDLQLTARASGTCETDGPGRLLFDGRLRAFWRTHGSFATGLPVMDSMSAGDTVVVDAVITVVDDDAAAGRDVELSFSFESRPT